MIRVIVADDQPLILDNIVSKIKSIHSEIEIIATATDGIHAYELISTLKPDIVFTDIRMPGLDGIELIRRCRAENAAKYFVLISGYQKFEYARQALQLNVVEYLLKPITLHSISEIIQKLVEKIQIDNSKTLNDIFRNLLISENISELTLPIKPISFIYFFIGKILSTRTLIVECCLSKYHCSFISY